MQQRSYTNYPAFKFTALFPANELWRFFVDGTRQQKDGGIASFYAKEPFYFVGMYKAAKIAFSNFHLPLTPTYITNLREAACADVIKVYSRDYRSNSSVVTFNGVKDGSTITGLTEFLNKIENGSHPIRILYQMSEGYYTISKDTFAEIKNGFKSNEEFAKHIYNQDSFAKQHDLDRIFLATDNQNLNIESSTEATINKYNTAITHAHTPEKKLEVIIECIQNLEQTHPFNDGNCRTFIMLLLNRLLLSNGFYPTILDDPNRFDGYSIKELIQEVKLGMLRTMEIINGKVDLYGVKTVDAIKTLRGSDEDDFKEKLHNAQGILSQAKEHLLSYFQQKFDMEEIGAAADSEIEIKSEIDSEIETYETFLLSSSSEQKEEKTEEKEDKFIKSDSFSNSMIKLRDLQLEFEKEYTSSNKKSNVSAVSKPFRRPDFNYNSEQLKAIVQIKKDVLALIKTLTPDQLQSPEFKSFIAIKEPSEIPHVVDFQVTPYKFTLTKTTTTRQKIKELLELTAKDKNIKNSNIGSV